LPNQAICRTRNQI